MPNVEVDEDARACGDSDMALFAEGQGGGWRWADTAKAPDFVASRLRDPSRRY
eukprot:CAMPEP_0170193204 /NCGR_PEP_ID=MMETSP0040_2-20121228/56373_1 /TAXON_ID=641309 /ORGANISM="Lotharella oceanica, Strain CCMP622" /LENGTH=52 /DNA_ID=CAMNT_0010441789 /DNA_START=145 /DNA_END=303 /DNA_ORIENTATION=-